MKITAIILGCLGVGYLVGSLVPVQGLLTPKRQIEFETDSVIKAGHKATSRYFGTSMEPRDLPVEISFTTADEFPTLKLKDSSVSP